MFLMVTCTAAMPGLAPPESVAVPEIVMLHGVVSQSNLPVAGASGSWITSRNTGLVIVVSGGLPFAVTTTECEAGVGSCWPPPSTALAWIRNGPPSNGTSKDADHPVLAVPGLPSVAALSW